MICIFFPCKTGGTRLFSHTQPQAAPFFSERETSALQLTGSGTSPVLSSSSSSSAPARLVPSAGDVCALLTIETVRVLCVCAYKQRQKAEGAAFRGAVFFPPEQTQRNRLQAHSLSLWAKPAATTGRGRALRRLSTQHNTTHIHTEGAAAYFWSPSHPLFFVQ